MKTSTLLLIALPALSCATPGSHPHDMSSADHEATAQREEQAAAAHQSRYDADASVTRERCRPNNRASIRSSIDGFPPDVCWTSVTNPTDVHRREGEDHRRMAADHRAGSSALGEAEARACVGVGPNDRDISPFEHAEDITSVAALKAAGVNGGKLPIEETVGAVIAFRAVPGMTAEWLQRVVDCHLARNASMGHLMPEMPNCPLVPTGLSAKVSSTGNGFAVSIRSGDPATAREVLARAERLMPSRKAALSTQP